MSTKQINIIVPCGDIKKNYARMTSPFGNRRHPVNGKEDHFHNGIDLRSANVPSAPYIYSGVPGEVVRVLEPNPKYPCLVPNPPKGEVLITPYVMVRDEDKQVHVYAHIKPSVKVGIVVGENSILGDTRANWGYSTAIHLHYTIFKKGYNIKTSPWDKANFKYCINPYEFLSAQGVIWCDKDFKPLTEKTPVTKR